MLCYPTFSSDIEKPVFRQSVAGKSEVKFILELFAQMKARKNKSLIVLCSATPELEGEYLKELEKAGYEVINCHNPLRATKLFEGNPASWRPTLFLIDVLLTQISGFELVRRINQVYVGKNPAVIMISQYDTMEDRIEAENAGAIGLIKKPASIEAITEMVKIERERRARIGLGPLGAALNFD